MYPQSPVLVENNPLVSFAKLYDAKFPNARGLHQPPPPTPAKVAKYGKRARVNIAGTRTHIHRYLKFSG